MNIDDDSNSEMMVCSEGVCKKAVGPGYYLAYINENEFYFYYCDSFNKCEKSSESDGYFINSTDNTIIKCSNNNCIIFKNDSNTCAYHYYEVILYSDKKPYYCNGKKRISFSNSEIYYFKASSFDASSIYPIYNQGSDTILLKIDEYSVTQFITGSNGIYITFKNIVRFL